MLAQAEEAKVKTSEENLKENVKIDILGYQVENKSEDITAEQLKETLDKYFTNVPKTAEGLAEKIKEEDLSLKAKDEYGKDLSIKMSDIYEGKLATNTKEQLNGIPTVTVDGKLVELTKDNVKYYLGKLVTNFKDDSEKTEIINIDNKEITVSKKYRLYYVDFENKYKDGEGTIYLKAECTGNNNSLQLDKSTADTEGIRIKQLNPSLYEEGKTAPNSSNENMQAVTWLLNDKKWESLKNGVKIEKKFINYIVGAPSLEMMMDSYNTHYDLTGETPEIGALTEDSARKKIFYKYENGKTGYQVGPGSDSEYKDIYTADYTIKTDKDIDTMYYPGSGQVYWIASPSAGGSNYVNRMFHRTRRCNSR